MRGGRDLVAADFIRPKISDMFHPEMIDGKPHVFFGGKYTDPFRFVVFNRELVKLLGKKSIGIDVLEGNDVKHVDLNVLSLELQYELSRLREFLKDETEYKTIQEFLEKYGILQKIKEQTFSNIPADYTTYSKKYDISYNPHTKLVKTDKYSILFFGFLQSTPSFCLVFTDNAFIIIDFKQIKDKDIISIEDLFGSSFHFSDYIYLLATDDNVQGFIKEKLNKLIETEKKIREKIRKYFKHYDLKNIEIQTDDLLHILKEEFPDIHNQNIFYRIIDQEKTFIRKQIEKSKRAHMKNNSNKTIRVVYGNDINNQNNYDRFLKEGKRLAIAEKAETNEKQAQRKAKENEEKANRNNKQAQINAEKDRRNAEKAQRNAEKAQRNAEKDQRNEQMLRNQEEENNFMTSMKSTLNSNKKKYTPNQKNRNMAKNFIKELYKKDKKFISNLVRWYWSHVVVIYNKISDNFENRSINHRSNDFNGKLREDLTPEKLYESENFPKNNSLNYTYEESQAFARFFIDTLNAHMQSKWIDYYNLMKYHDKSRSYMYDLFKTELEKFMNKVLNEELNIQFTNNRNGNNNNGN